jgi:hypothetical protein
MWMGIVLLSAAARLVPHPWNFTPLVAIGLFAGVYAESAIAAAAATLLFLALGDLVLGFYPGILWNYAAALVPVMLGRWARGRKGASVAGAALASSLSFFAISNFSVWAGGLIYPRTLAGLASCYAAGVPFYRNQIAGDAFYTLLMFGAYELLVRRYRISRAAA